jgi:Uma2 family endonuclease
LIAPEGLLLMMTMTLELEMDPFTLDGHTAADLSNEPEDGLGRELHDGVIYVVPPASQKHQWVEDVLGDALKAHRPADVAVFRDLGVHTGSNSLYVPDVVAVQAGTRFHDNGYDAAGVLLVVEVVSRSSVTMDRHAKPGVYAECGIQWYWRVERNHSVHCFRLEDGKYMPILEAGRGERVEFDEPWRISFAVDDLVLPKGF